MGQRSWDGAARGACRQGRDQRPKVVSSAPVAVKQAPFMEIRSVGGTLRRPRTKWGRQDFDFDFDLFAWRVGEKRTASVCDSAVQVAALVPCFETLTHVPHPISNCAYPLFGRVYSHGAHARSAGLAPLAPAIAGREPGG